MEGLMVKKRPVCIVNFQGSPYFNHHKVLEKDKQGYSPRTNLKDQSIILNCVSQFNPDRRTSTLENCFQSQIHKYESMSLYTKTSNSSERMSELDDHNCRSDAISNEDAKLPSNVSHSNLNQIKTINDIHFTQLSFLN